MRVDIKGLRRGSVVFALLMAFALAILARGAYLQGADVAVLTAAAMGGLSLGVAAAATFMWWRRRHPVTEKEVRGARWTAGIPRGAFVASGLALGAAVAAAARGHGSAPTALIIVFVAANTGALLTAGLMLRDADYSWMDRHDPQGLGEIAHDSRDPSVGEAWSEAAPYQRVMLVAVGLTVAAMVAAAAWIALR
jgi:hypothetical protein